MRIEANPAGFPVVRHGSIASFPLTPVQLFPTFEADFSTFAGDSGGPVIVCDPRSKTPAGQSPLVLGIVISEIREDEKMAMLNEERTVHVPMNLGNAVQARFVRETIEMLKR